MMKGAAHKNGLKNVVCEQTFRHIDTMLNLDGRRHDGVA